MAAAFCPFCQSPLTSRREACPSCGVSPGLRPTASVRHLSLGHRLHQGKFTVGRVLGEGGFGITYKGSHRDLRRIVAIKELFPLDLGAVRLGARVSVPATQADAFRRAQERALQEAQAIAGFRSRSIVDVYDMFRENDTAYIVMEYLEGQTLENRIQREGRVPPDAVLQIAQALCEALTEVHAGRLLHRDVKPANIVLTEDRRTVLIDFGSAREFQANRTQRHTRILTVPYAAPEQYLEKGRFGPYTDVFCLGATLYHALTGAPPPAVDRLQGRGELSFPAGSPAWLVAALQQALALRVDDRLQSMAAFLDAITDGAASAPAASASGRSARLRTWHAPIADGVASAPVSPARPAATASRPLAAGSSPDDEREALAALYASASGTAWADHTAWLSSAPLATWHGVTVDDAGRVIGLRLIGNGLSGAIPAALGRLIHLQKLTLSNNQLSGSIPDALSRLPHLEELVLANNQLTGRIPSALERLTRLQRLSLHGNQLSGAIPAELSALTRLKELVLSDNQLSSRIPTELGGLTALQRLSLHGNRLSGAIPAELGRLTSLQALVLSDNRLSGAIPAELSHLAELQRLSLHNNRLSGRIPVELGQLASLQRLSLYSNRLQGALPAAVAHMTYL